MKHTCFAWLAALAVVAGCAKKDELLDCPGSCTVVTGRLLTSGSIPLAKTPVSLEWHGRFSGLNGEVRKKAVGTTDANGHYRLSAFLADDELPGGYLSVNFQANKSTYYFIGEPHIAFFDYKRDTLLLAPDYLIPRKAFIKLAITNPNQVPKLGAYMSDFNSCYGENTVFSQNIRGGGAVIDWFSLPSQNPLDMPGDQSILVRHYKNTTNGLPSSTDIIFIPAGTTRTYTVTY